MLAQRQRQRRANNLHIVNNDQATRETDLAENIIGTLLGILIATLGAVQIAHCFWRF